MIRSSLVCFALLLPQLALGQSSKLWSERSEAAPLAQIPDFAELAAHLTPAVVAISVEQKAAKGGNDPYEFFFGPFGGGGPGHEFHNKGLGSGFVIAKEGLILTNYHVVEDAETIEVSFTLPDHTEKNMSAKVIGVAPEYDVALIQTVEPANVPVTYLGDSDKVRIGEWVMAVGNPFGLSQTVSVGIISAKERRGIEPSGRAGLYDFLQTDASINPGNSGGPLVNMHGEVIGINAAINAAGQGIGFAIPINMVKGMLPELKSKGKFTRSWIGIKIQPLTPELATSYGLDRPLGALVSEVVPAGPAAEAGLKEGDVILEFDGKPVRTSSDLPLYASMAGVGKKVSVRYWRGKKDGNASLKLSEYPGDQAMAGLGGDKGEGAGLGIIVADVTPDIAHQLDLDIKEGVVIKTVDEGSPAARQGLRPGDVILSLNGDAIKRARQFADTVRGLDKGAVLRMQVLRKGGRLFVALRKP